MKLLTTSLHKTHGQAVLAAKAAGSALLGPSTMVEGRYSHRECVEAHLDLMMFLLKEGDLYLSWSRCGELWEALVANPNSIQGCKSCPSVRSTGIFLVKCAAQRSQSRLGLDPNSFNFNSL